MSWPKIDPQILALLLDGGEELAGWAWHKLTGDATDDRAKKAIESLRSKGAAGFIKAMQDELEAQAAIYNLEMQLLKLGPLTEHVLDAFTTIDNPTVPVLGLPIEIVPPDEPLKPDDAA